MSKRVSEIAHSLKQLGDLQVNDWDFMELLNTEIKDLEISRSLKRLGSVRVMDWDFRTVLPAVKKVANQDVDVVDLFKRTANYKVMEWDFRSSAPVEIKPVVEAQAEPLVNISGTDKRQEITAKLKNFLQYVAVNLIDEPKHAQLKVIELGPDVLRFKLVLVKKDVAMLIGREGFTATAMRNILKAAAGMYGVQALLQIHSHEEEAAFLAKQETRR